MFAGQGECVPREQDEAIRRQPVERLESGTEMGPGPRAKGPWAQLAIEQAPPHWEDT